MTTILRYLLLASAVVAVSLACLCQRQTTKEAFCEAHWVSHVRVEKQELLEDTSRRGWDILRYSVKHLDVYKTPANLTTLPDDIFTPSESPACGLLITAGKEYLLAGRVEGNSLYTGLCGQVLPDDQEWKNVPKTRQEKLKTIKC